MEFYPPRNREFDSYEQTSDMIDVFMQFPLETLEEYDNYRYIVYYTQWFRHKGLSPDFQKVFTKVFVYERNGRAGDQRMNIYVHSRTYKFILSTI